VVQPENAGRNEEDTSMSNDVNIATRKQNTSRAFPRTGKQLWQECLAETGNDPDRALELAKERYRAAMDDAFSRVEAIINGGRK
jgi:hypothetical protein